jgi:ankyrin repeat protein
MRCFLPTTGYFFLSRLPRKCKSVVQNDAVVALSKKFTSSPFSTTPSKRAQINDIPMKPITTGPSDDLSLHYQIKYPLHHAIMVGNNSDASRLLTDANDVNSLDERSNYPLMVSVMTGRPDLCKLLIDKGALVGASCPTGQTALHLAVVARSNIMEKGGRFESFVNPERIEECIQILVADGADHIDAQDSFGQTALLLAVYFRDKFTLTNLIQHGATLDIKDAQGRTALHVAAEHEDKSILIHLIQHGASLDIKDLDGDTALHLAAIRGQTECIEALLNNGSLLNAANNKGRTALHLASMGRHSESVSILIKRGADRELKDNLGHRALNLAKGNAATLMALRTPINNTQASQGQAISTPVSERVAFGNSINGARANSKPPKRAASKENTQHGKHSTRNHAEIHQVGSNMPAKNTPAGTQSGYQIEEIPADDMFEALKEKIAAHSEFKPKLLSWADSKIELDMTSSSDAEQTEEAMLRAAMLSAAELDFEDEFNEGMSFQPEDSSSALKSKPHCGNADPNNAAGHQIANQPPLDMIEFTPLTTKWFERADKRGREMLLRRVKRLSEASAFSGLS